MERIAGLPVSRHGDIASRGSIGLTNMGLTVIFVSISERPLGEKPKAGRYLCGRSEE